MKRTKSGIHAIGEPMSNARIKAEAAHARENGFQNLFLTDEGIYIAKRICCILGFRLAGVEQEAALEYWDREYRQVSAYLSGITYDDIPNDIADNEVNF